MNFLREYFKSPYYRHILACDERANFLLHFRDMQEFLKAEQKDFAWWMGLEIWDAPRETLCALAELRLTYPVKPAICSYTRRLALVYVGPPEQREVFLTRYRTLEGLARELHVPTDEALKILVERAYGLTDQ